MDDDGLFDLQAADFAPLESTGLRLALLTWEEAHDLLRLLVTIAQENGPLSPEAERLAREIAARMSSDRGAAEGLLMARVPGDGFLRQQIQPGYGAGSACGGVGLRAVPVERLGA